ncbi:hypothetical protein B0H17DRAFT_877217, partial [Mycena rosella]
GTALHAASARGHQPVVELLFQNGADVNQMAQGTIALFAASAHGRKIIVRSLIASGADSNLQG